MLVQNNSRMTNRRVRFDFKLRLQDIPKAQNVAELCEDGHWVGMGSDVSPTREADDSCGWIWPLYALVGFVKFRGCRWKGKPTNNFLQGLGEQESTWIAAASDTIYCRFSLLLTKWMWLPLSILRMGVVSVLSARLPSAKYIGIAQNPQKDQRLGWFWGPHVGICRFVLCWKPTTPRAVGLPLWLVGVWIRSIVSEVFIWTLWPGGSSYL